MKTRLLLAAMALALFATSGCMTANLNKIVAALGKDQATVHVRISSVYGVIEVSRTNPGTNTQPHTVYPDGKISVKEEP